MFTQSTKIIFQPSFNAISMKKQMLLQPTTGVYKSESSNIRSPLRQILALHLMISPAGFCLYRKTHVHGTICSPFASVLRHLIHTFLALSCLISFNAASSHAFQFAISANTLSYDRMSGFFLFDALNTSANACGGSLSSFERHRRICSDNFISIGQSIPNAAMYTRH